MAIYHSYVSHYQRVMAWASSTAPRRFLRKTAQAKEVCNQTADHKALIRKFVKDWLVVSNGFKDFTWELCWEHMFGK